MKIFLLILIFSGVAKTQLQYLPTSTNTLMDDIREIQKSISELKEKTEIRDEFGSYQTLFQSLDMNLKRLQLRAFLSCTQLPIPNWINQLSRLDEKMNVINTVLFKINHLEEKLDKLQIPSKMDVAFTKMSVLENSVKQINNKLENNKFDINTENLKCTFENYDIQNISNVKSHENKFDVKQDLNKIDKVENKTGNLKSTFEKYENISTVKSQEVNVTKLIGKGNKSEETNKTNHTQLISSECFDSTFINSSERLSGKYRFYSDLNNLTRLCRNGWLVIQRRDSFDVQENFNRSWNDYKHGFGDVRKEFWIGNNVLHRLSDKNDLKLRIELETFSGKKMWAEYKSFKIGNEDDYFRLKIGTYSGNATDSFTYHNNMYFSTIDKLVSKDGRTCPLAFHSGWWFNNCLKANLNGVYRKAEIKAYRGIHWNNWNYQICLKQVEMMITTTKKSTKIIL
ncbi:angiopoietin-related protein 7-like [Onthophagus taurus]|uniref:angiopoietin-related protein 7-like n=1 Tax=Onthophagus taurus TaxID=166361 RepID=UPI0039BE1495